MAVWPQASCPGDGSQAVGGAGGTAAPRVPASEDSSPPLRWLQPWARTSP